MRALNVFLFILAIVLFVLYFIVSLVASVYAISEGWGLSILVVYAIVCAANLFLAVFIKLKNRNTNFNKSINIISIILCVINILLAMKGMIGVQNGIELYNTIKNFTN